MKILTALKLFSIFLFWVTGGYAQEEASASKNNLQLVKVASLNTIDANKEFQKNVQLVQQQRALAAQILTKINSTSEKQEKAKLQSQLENLQKKLNENNQLMFKTYGFSLNRNYVLTVEKSHIHMWVSEDEAEAIRSRSPKSK
ncbi:MAG: hypothetical protein VX153_07625 [Verrucomicrobiota bacterium]|nr:hypothetical protein [Verrucomicrobiota bacterium]